MDLGSDDLFNGGTCFFPLLEEEEEEEVEERSRLGFCTDNERWSLDPNEYCDNKSALFCAKFEVFKMVSKLYWFVSINDPVGNGCYP